MSIRCETVAKSLYTAQPERGGASSRQLAEMQAIGPLHLIISRRVYMNSMLQGVKIRGFAVPWRVGGQRASTPTRGVGDHRA